MLIEVAGHQFLAGASLASDQDANGPGRDQANRLVHLHHGATLADNGILCGCGLPDFHRLGHEPPGRDGLVDQTQQFRCFKGLEKIFIGAELGRRDGRPGRVMGRHQNDRQMRVGGVQDFY